MLWFKSRSTVTLDQLILKEIKKQRLRIRVYYACRDTVDYQLRLKNAMIKHQDNVNLLTKIAGHMAYLQSQKVGIQEAAKETIELFLH